MGLKSPAGGSSTFGRGFHFEGRFFMSGVHFFMFGGRKYVTNRDNLPRTLERVTKPLKRLLGRLK